MEVGCWLSLFSCCPVILLYLVLIGVVPSRLPKTNSYRMFVEKNKGTISGAAFVFTLLVFVGGMTYTVLGDGCLGGDEDD